jgi:hypothetical protein
MTHPPPTQGPTIVQVKQPPPSGYAILAGLLFFTIGAAGLIADYYIALANRQTPHVTHIAIWAGLCVLGVLVPFGRYVLPVVSQVVVIFGDYLPGGRRRGDPPVAP